MNRIVSKYKIVCVVLLVEVMTLFAVAVWAGMGNDTECFRFANTDTAREITLAKGTYRAYINYESDDPISAVTFISESEDKHFQADTLQLYPWKQADFLQLWAYDDISDVKAAFHDNSGNTRITGILIVKTNESRKMLLGIMLTIMIGIDGMLLWLKRLQETKDKKWDFVIRTGLILLAVAIVSAPLLVDSLLEGDDLLFHLVRIEGIKDAIQTGQFPARIQPNWFEGAGYALSVFYGDFLLYIAVFFRILGFSLQASYKIYLFVITLGTVATTYYALNKVCVNKWASTVGTTIYLLSTYRLCDMYTRASVGEFSSMMFTPLVICGFYCIFTMGNRRKSQTDAGEKPKGHLWIMPAIGMAGILATHCITSLMVTLALFLWCICNIRILFQKDIFKNLCKTVAATIFLSAGWLIPFADYMLNTSVAINKSVENSMIQIQSAGIPVEKMFALIPDCKSIQVFGVIYFLMVLIAVGRIIANVFRNKKMTDKEKQIVKLIVVFVLLAICSTNIFPWDALTSSSKIVATYARTMQYPFRLAAVAQMMSVFVFSAVFPSALQNKDTNAGEPEVNDWIKKGVIELSLIGMAGILLGIMISNTFVIHPIRYKIYDAAGAGLFAGYGTYSTYFVYGGEYLPDGVDVLEYRWHNVYPEEGVTIASYQKEGTKVTMKVENSSEEEKAIGLPLLYYRGYEAEYNGGNRMDTYSGENSMVTVKVPDHYSGMIVVNYYVPWYWRTSEMLSMISVLYIVLLIIKGRFQRKRPF